MSRKSYPILSSLQTFLRQDNEIIEPTLLLSHLCKKVEAVIHTLPTIPLLRGVALETLSSGFIYIFEHQEIKEDSSLSTSLLSACELISSLLLHCRGGWSDLLFNWGVDLLARLSALQNQVPEDKMDYWMSQSLVKHVIEYITIGVQYKIDKNEERSVINCVMTAADKHKTDLGWLLSHIISQNAAVLTPKLFDNNSNYTSPIVVTTMSHCLDILIHGYPSIVQKSLMIMIKAMTEGDGEKGDGESVSSLRLLVQLMLQSQRVLKLIGKELLSVVTSQHIYHVLCGAIEGGISDSDGDRNRDKEDEGELVSDNENEEDEGRGGGGEMEHSGLTVSIVSNLSSILLQLSGPDAISAINLIIGCVILCKISNDCDEEEDGEINTSAIAKRQLLEGVQQLMVDVLATLHKAVTSILLSTPSPSSDPAPLRYTISLQAGLTEWTTQLTDTRDEILCDFLIQLIECVCICSSEITGAQVLSLFISKCTQDKLPIFISLHQKYLLQHSDITNSLINEGISLLTKEDSIETTRQINQWCNNLYLLTTTSNHISTQFKTALPSSFISLLSLLPLTTPTSAIPLLDTLASVAKDFVEYHGLSQCLTAVQCILRHFCHLLSQLAHDIMNDREADILAKEYQLSQCRKIISIFSRNNHSIEHFICSYIIQLVTSKEMMGYFSLSHQTGHTDRKTNSLLIDNSIEVAPQVGSLFNTRQAQHSGSLQKQDTPTLSLQLNEKLSQSLSQVAVTHCNDHILWLVSDITGKSTNQIAVILMDIAAPNSLILMKIWPEVESTGYTRQTLELHLSIKRKMDQYPILWKLLHLVAKDSQGFLKCSSLVHSLLVTLMSHWGRGRYSPSTSYPQELSSSQTLIQCIAKAGWIPKPLCYISELFEFLSCEEVSLLHHLCFKYIQDNYQSIISNYKSETLLDENTRKSLKAILKKNIDKLGHLYCRFTK